MKHELIKTDDYLLVVSNEEIREQSGNDTIFNKNINKITAGIYQDDDNQFKVLAHLPLNGSPYLDGVDVLPELKDQQVEKLADEYVQSVVKIDIEPRSYDLNSKIGIYGGACVGFKDGYNKAKETYKYTEEDLINAIQMAKEGNIGYYSPGCPNYYFEYSEEQIKLSLNQQKLPIAFECEPRYLDIDEIRERGKGFLNGNSIVPKTTTNSEGRTEWVGKYLF